ncbi:MAG TPA: HTH domain-containing protein [Candidatus Altiarchaeales archaeon]|nr:HTH domain-containing protein [Candidatus Altiarchaeales archaeon]
MEEDITPIDRLILTTLKSSKKPLTTYKIAKKTKLSWSTANTHCYKLKSMGLLEMNKVKNRVGQIKIFWDLKDKSKK